MKTIKIVLYALCTILLVACDLDKYPVDKINPDTFFESEKDLNLYVMSFYEMLPEGEDIYKTDGELSDYFATSASPDLFINGNYTALDASGWDWEDLYNVNYFLARSDNPEILETVRNHYIGIARFFRAWFYYNKVKKFGDVPWYDKTMQNDDPDLYKGRDSREVVMNKVLEDLNFACTHIYETKDNTASTINRWVALAFKSRVCLFEGTFRKYHPEFDLENTVNDWLREAKEAAGEVMEKGGYSLNKAGSTQYRDLLTNENNITTEVMLADNYSGTMARYNDANWVWTTSSTWVRPGLTRKFINTFLRKDGRRFTDQPDYNEIEFTDEVQERDARLAQIIRTPSYKLNGKLTAPDLGHTKTGYHVIKFTQDDNTNMAQAKNTNTIPVIRYAEVLLNYAEAARELGEFTSQDWKNTIGVLRGRAGITNTAEPASADTYLQEYYFPSISDAVLLEIRRERGIEMVSEGLRFDDIRRWKEGHLMEDTWDGIYVKALDTEYDLNQDGQPDVCFVKKIPVQTKPGVVYYVLSASMRLTGENAGNIQVYPNVNKKFEEKKYLYPIPEDARLINPALGQNKGWEL